jgi:hypothetical protein
MRIQASDVNIGTPIIYDGDRYIVEQISTLYDPDRIRIICRCHNHLKYLYLRPFDRVDSEMVWSNAAWSLPPIPSDPVSDIIRYRDRYLLPQHVVEGSSLKPGFDDTPPQDVV